MKLKKIMFNNKEMISTNNNNQKNKEVECRYCHVIGHIKSKCPKLLARSQAQGQNVNNVGGNYYQPVFQQSAKYAKPTLLVNTNVVKKDEFPTLGAPRNFNQTTTLNFASVFKKKEENLIPINQLQENESILNGQVMEILK